MRRSIAPLVAASALFLSGCAYIPFLHPHHYVVFFQPNSTVLDKPGIAVIESAAHAAATVPLITVHVYGAADTAGTTPQNVKLAEARAAVVAEQLIADGVPSGRIAAEGLGEVGSPPSSSQASRTATIKIGP